MSDFDDVNDELQGSGAPAAKFENVGDVVKGEVVAATKRQQFKFGTKELAFWDDGQPKMQVIITLRQDDGEEVALFAKKPSSMLNAIREAVQAAGTQLEQGGTLAVKFTELKPSEKAGFNPQKIFTAQYKAPAPAAMAASDLI